MPSIRGGASSPDPRVIHAIYRQPLSRNIDLTIHRDSMQSTIHADIGDAPVGEGGEWMACEIWRRRIGGIASHIGMRIRQLTIGGKRRRRKPVGVADAA